MLRMQFYGIVERANAIIDHFRPVARPAVLAQPRLGPPLLAKAVFAMSPINCRKAVEVCRIDCQRANRTGTDTVKISLGS